MKKEKKDLTKRIEKILKGSRDKSVLQKIKEVQKRNRKKGGRDE